VDRIGRALILVFLVGITPACTLGHYVREQAARDFVCPKDRVQTTSDDGWVFTARGCGRQAIYLGPAAASPITRASYDLSCAPEQLSMVYLGNYAVGVEGCGKKITYAYVDGAWIGNSP
jgi:hypothetical protein